MIAVLSVASAACDFGSGGGSSAPVAPVTAASTVTLSWEPAVGPVSGYAVYVQRNDGAFDRELDVAASQVTLSGEPGDTASIVVAAFDPTGNIGPGSAPSPLFTFPGTEAGDPIDATPPANPSPLPPAPSPGASDPGAGSDDSEEEESDLSSVSGALVWRSDASLKITTSAFETLLELSVSEEAELLAVADFDADGSAELLWHEAGQLSTTSLVEGATALPFGQIAAGDEVLASGDFDGDGAADLLLHSAAGGLRTWLATAEAPSASLGGHDGADLAGVGDFDGDGLDDLAWLAADGSLVLWFMDGAQAHSQELRTLESGLEAGAAGDFDADGVAELALLGADGAVYGYDVERDQLMELAAAGPGPWRTPGASDLDADGDDDLVLVSESALLLSALSGEAALPQNPTSPWELVALLP